MDNTELKIKLQYHGLKISREAKAHLSTDDFGKFTINDYSTTGGITLVINRSTYVNVPINNKKDALFRLGFEHDFTLSMSNNKLPVSVEAISAPKYALENRLLDNQTPINSLVMTHADRVRLSPIQGCAFSCKFCSCCKSMYYLNSKENLDQALQVAINDPYLTPRHAIITGGTPKRNATDYKRIDSIYSYFPKQYSELEWDVMLAPRSKLPNSPSCSSGYSEYLVFIKECGFTALSINIELVSQQARKRYIEDKDEIGLSNYLLFIEKAVELFGVGQVRSAILVGLEPVENTLSGVSRLLDIGCLPMLSPFIPAAGTSLSQYPQSTPEILLNTVFRAADLAAKASLQLAPICKACTHNTLSIE